MMYVCKPAPIPTSLSDYDVSLRASSAHFKPVNKTTKGQGGSQFKLKSHPDCCEQRLERIKLHSGYRPASTAYVPINARNDSTPRCVLFLNEQTLPQTPCSSRRTNFNGLPILLPDSDDEKFDSCTRRGVAFSTYSDVITAEKLKQSTHSQLIDDTSTDEDDTDDSESENVSRLLEVSLSAIMSTTGTKMPRPILDMEPLWKTKEHKRTSETYHRDAIEFPEADLVLDKFNVLRKMGSSIYTMKQDMKELIKTPQDYRFLSRFVQVTRSEAKTSEMEKQPANELPLGDHLEKPFDDSPLPMKQQHNQPTLTRPNCYACTTRELLAFENEDDELWGPPRTPKHKKRHSSSRKRRTKRVLPVETLQRTESPAVVWRSQHHHKLIVKGEADVDSFKSVMCG